jgi:CIC family chloride channel protein
MSLKQDLKALFPPTYRLIGACLAVGALGALAALAFDAAVSLAQRLLLVQISGYVPPPVGVLNPTSVIPIMSHRWLLPLATGLGGLLSGLLVFTLAPEAEGHGTDAAVGSYHRSGGEIRTRIPFIKGLASAITIGSGGVAGREGPTAHISVGLGAILARLLKFRGQERRILLLAAMSAGLAAIFRAPLGMAIFSVEILYSGMVFESEALIYTVISAVTAYALHGFVVGWEPIFTIPRGLVFESPGVLLGFVVLGILAGVAGALLPTLFYRVRDAFLRLPGPRHYKPALGGVLAGLIGMAAPQILGTGYGWVELAMAGTLSLSAILVILLLKGPAMALTIGSGGSGGVFAPTVTLGAMLGGAVGISLQRLLPALHVVPAAFVVVGMAAIFSGAARTPISTLIMVAEMTGGYGLIVPAMLANILAFMVQTALTRGWRYPTLYESQVATREDSPVHRGVFVRRALELIEGGAVDTAEVSLPRLVSLLRFGGTLPVTHGAAMLLALGIAPGSTLDGSTIAAGIGAIEATAVAVLRGEEMIVPRGSTQLAAGDQLIAVATPHDSERLRELAGMKMDPGST